MSRAFAVRGLIPLLVLASSACVSKGTHNVALADLAQTQAEREDLLAEIERRQAVERGLRAELADSLRTARAREAELRADTTRLAREVERMDMLRSQARAEADRLETALGDRGVEFRQLQRRLEALSDIEQEIRDRNRIYEDIIGRFRSLIDGGQLSVEIVRGRLVIQLPQDILFESGSAVVGSEGRETLASVGAVLAELDERRFQIEGHTDNVPISTPRFPSNWELSSARALAVVRILIEQGVDPANVSGAGYGEFQPVADNDDRDGRRLNRRIEIVMLPNLDVIATAPPPR